MENNRYPIKFDERLPVDRYFFFFFSLNAVNLQKHNRKNIISRYGWQTQGPPAGSTKRPGGGSYSGGVFYEGSIIGDR